MTSVGAKRPQAQNTRFSDAELAAHTRMLEEKVFQTATKWPHFSRLLQDVRELAAAVPQGAHVACMERGLLYGGLSLFGPYFHAQEFVSIDCSPGSADSRGAYNKSMVDDDRCLTVPSSVRAPAENTGLPGGSFDLVMVPNLVHHVADQRGLFAEIARLMKPGGRGYIFEPLVRELHQWPDDYLRYTPSGFRTMVEEAGLVFESFVPEGGPFQAVAYCWTQALEYFPPEKRREMEDWFYGRHFAELMGWDETYRENLARKHTSFPMAYAIHFHKPV
jgi:SAM-dependent methyltransferase